MHAKEFSSNTSIWLHPNFPMDCPKQHRENLIDIIIVTSNLHPAMKREFIIRSRDQTIRLIGTVPFKPLYLRFLKTTLSTFVERNQNLVVGQTISSSSYLWAKKQVTYNSRTRFSYLCTTTWAAAKTFRIENAVSKKPLQANGQTWVAISR